MRTQLLVRLAHSLLVLFAFSASGCSDDPYTNAGVIGGVGGGVAGAGTGAIIGATITDGLVLESAGVGAAVGIPLGIAVGLSYQYAKEQAELNRNDEVIERNYEYIVARQQEIDALRARVVGESQTIRVNPRKQEDIFVSPTIGTLGY